MTDIEIQKNDLQECNEKYALQKNEKEKTEDDTGCLTEVQRKTLLGLVITIFLAISWVGAQQYGQTAVTSEDFHAAYFSTWYSTCWEMLCFPGYCVFLVIMSFFSEGKANFNQEIKKSLQLFGTQKITLYQFFTRIVTMNVLWVAVNYAYLFGLKFIAATDASAIMASNVAFVYILSLFILNEDFLIIRLIASTVCITGIVLIGYADGFHGTTLTGVLLVLTSAIGAAVYKVIFKKMVGAASLGQVSLFLSLLGLSNALFLWTFALILYFTGVDEMVPSNIPWSYLNISAALGLIFNFLVNFGIAYTYPLFISIAMMVGVPLNAGVDIIVKDVVFDALRLVGALTIIIGFGLMLFPDHWNYPIHRFLGFKGQVQRVNVDDIDNDTKELDEL